MMARLMLIASRSGYEPVQVPIHALGPNRLLYAISRRATRAIMHRLFDLNACNFRLATRKLLFAFLWIGADGCAVFEPTNKGGYNARGSRRRQRDMQITTSALYDQYFGPESIVEQAPLFSSREDVVDYVNYQIKEHYPDDGRLAEFIATALWDELSTVRYEINGWYNLDDERRACGEIDQPSD